MNKAVIYARVSSKEQEREGFSIPAQLELLRAYALQNNLAVMKEFTDAETAKKTGRTSYTEMLAFLKKNKDVKHLLVEKTDRLYRNFKDYVVLENYKIEIHLIKEGTILSEDSRSSDKFVHGIKVLMAKNYIDNLSEEVKKGQLQRAKEGYVANAAPYGYKKIDLRNCAIDENTAPFVRRAFELYSVGDISLKKLSQKLYDEGFVYKETKSIINLSKLEHILKSHTYYGMVEFKGKLFEGKHEPIINKALFDLTQLAFSKDNKPKYSNTHDFLFAGMITCKKCGCTISGEIKKGKYVYYSCTGGKGKCDQQHVYIREEDIEKEFINAIKKVETSQQQKEWIVETLKSTMKETQDYAKEQINSLTQKRENLKTRLSKIYLDKLDGKITEEFWLEHHNQWTNDVMTIQNKLSAYEATSINFLEVGVQFLKFVTEISDLYQYGTSEQKRIVLNKLLQNCTIEGRKLSYEYKKPFHLFAEGLSYTKELGRKDSNL